MTLEGIAKIIYQCAENTYGESGIDSGIDNICEYLNYLARKYADEINGLI